MCQLCSYLKSCGQQKSNSCCSCEPQVPNCETEAKEAAEAQSFYDSLVTFSSTPIYDDIPYDSSTIQYSPSSEYSLLSDPLDQTNSLNILNLAPQLNNNQVSYAVAKPPVIPPIRPPVIPPPIRRLMPLVLQNKSIMSIPPQRTILQRRILQPLPNLSPNDANVVSTDTYTIGYSVAVTNSNVTFDNLGQIFDDQAVGEYSIGTSIELDASKVVLGNNLNILLNKNRHIEVLLSTGADLANTSVFSATLQIKRRNPNLASSFPNILIIQPKRHITTSNVIIKKNKLFLQNGAILKIKDKLKY